MLNAAVAEGHHAVFRAIDHGEGMDAEQIRAFMNRRPLESRPGTRGEKGTGIGLTLVAGLCDQAGWPVTVSSIVGEGTRFSVSVPLPEPG